MKNAKPIKGQYRQGDVLIELTAPKRAPGTAERLNKIVLAEGEATGHAHVLRTGRSDPADWWKDGLRQFAAVDMPAVVVHEEHGPIKLEEGTYEITRQREYSPEAIRNVAD